MNKPCQHYPNHAPKDRCPRCGAPDPYIHIHGHEQCRVCQFVRPCCQPDTEPGEDQ
jgi:hypothetical protein